MKQSMLLRGRIKLSTEYFTLLIQMEINYDHTAFVQPDEAPLEDIPVYSKTASRRTVAKYLKRKSTQLKLIAKDPNITDSNMDVDVCPTFDGSLDKELENAMPSFQTSYMNENYNHDLAPIIFSSNLPNFITNSSMQESKENNSSISEMLKCVLDSKNGFIETLEKGNDFTNPWMNNGMVFECYPSQLTGSSLSASIDKQEREIAYNLLLRRIIDETLDRNIIFSHQPKELLNLINSILVRQFPECEESKHRSKVRSYLKACRRNSKKNNGKILMKNTAAYLSSGPGNRLMHQIYNNEKETIDVIKKESEKFKLAQNVKQTQCKAEPSVLSTVSVATNQQQQILNITNSLPQLLPVSIHSIQTGIKPITKVCTSSKNAINLNQLPILLPLNNNNANNNNINTSSYNNNNKNNTNVNNNCNNVGNNNNPVESSRISIGKQNQNLLEDVLMKNFSEIVKHLVNSTDNNFTVPEIVTQLDSTARFLETFARILEKSVGNHEK